MSSLCANGERKYHAAEPEEAQMSEGENIENVSAFRIVERRLIMGTKALPLLE
jgi:hypothetical protein